MRSSGYGSCGVKPCLLLVTRAYNNTNGAYGASRLVT